MIVNFYFFNISKLKNEGNIVKIQAKVRDKNFNLKIFVKILCPKFYPTFMFDFEKKLVGKHDLTKEFDNSMAIKKISDI